MDMPSVPNVDNCFSRLRTDRETRGKWLFVCIVSSCIYHTPAETENQNTKQRTPQTKPRELHKTKDHGRNVFGSTLSGLAFMWETRYIDGSSVARNRSRGNRAHSGNSVWLLIITRDILCVVGLTGLEQIQGTREKAARHLCRKQIIKMLAVQSSSCHTSDFLARTPAVSAVGTTSHL